MRYDIVIIGGGIVGSSIAYHLARDGRGGTIAVIEPDPTYEFAATPRGTGGIRQLFSLPENIAMSQYGLSFFKAFPETMAVDGEPAAIDFHQGGYLFVVRASGAAALEANYHVQRRHGVAVDLLDAAGVKARFPSLDVADVALAAHSPEDGWIDPYSAVQGFRRKARSLGATYVADRAAAIEDDGRTVRAVRLASGETIGGAAFVNAAGAWAGEVAAMAGMKLPVEPMARLNHYFLCKAGVEPLPLVKEQSGLAFRPEGGGYIGGIPRWEVPAGFDFEIDHDYFEQAVWPALAARCPAFEALRHGRTWSGHYARNTLDANMILGPWIGGLENFHVACGFSGHGIMHAPAAGRAMAELILDGGFSTVDLGRMSYRRVIDDKPYAERGII